jgi:hypothetical protein
MVDNLDKFLQNRRVPEPASNLAERIITAAAARPARKPFRFGEWVGAVFPGFPLPQPALVMTLSMMAVVIAVGFYAGAPSSIPAGDEDILDAYLQATLDMNAWL